MPAAKNRKLPFLEDGSQYGVSRTDFRRMRKAEKRDSMLQWFHGTYEDPSNKTPHDEGEFVWIWGGPYNARDELYAKFDDIASESLIEEVVREVEWGGITNWAPVRTIDEEDVEDWEDIDSSNEPLPLDTFSDEPSPRYGTTEDLEGRAKARIALGRLQQTLDRPRPIGIGHNQPPEEPDEIKILRPALVELRAEFAKPNPSISSVKRWAEPLRNALIASGKWGVRKADKVVDGAMAAVGATGIVWLGHYYSPTLQNAFDAIISYLQIVANVVR
jgi:hypothetical protein